MVQRECSHGLRSVKLLLVFASTVIPGFSLLEIHDRDLYSILDMYVFRNGAPLRRRGPPVIPPMIGDVLSWPLPRNGSGMLTRERVSFLWKTVYRPLPSNEHLYLFHCSGFQPSCHNRMISEHWIEWDVERSRRHIICDNIQEFFWRDWGKPRKSKPE
jgi:hypothetical protein